MAIDFSKLSGASVREDILHPRDIFSILPRKSSMFQFPRDVQTEVWDKWFERKSEKNLVLKMNTGSGKTIVGLLILKSYLNEGIGPAVYITPTPYLVQQVISEGTKLGLNVTESESDPNFHSGNAILVINIYKLFNGLSVFGTIDTGKKIDIGCLIIDDAHACLGHVEKQFTIDIPNSSKIFGSLLKLFEKDLKAQSESLYLEIDSGDPYKSILLPFWTWQNHLSEITQTLHENVDDECLKYKWNLIKKYIKFCRCVVTGSHIEISTHNIPTEVIPSFYLAKRRIFMTATLSDDSVLLSHFGVRPNELTRTVSPKNANDIGDRIILTPQAYNPSITDVNIKQYAKAIAKRFNVVVLVPSIYRAAFWYNEADLTLNADNLEEGVVKLKKEHVGLVVIINKYDGIDLPGKACRMLILDSLPDMRREIDKYNQAALGQSELVINQRIQQIEQGMGRGVRSNDDYCAVILMGLSLTNYLFNLSAKNFFTNTTKAQIELAEVLAQQLHGSSIKEIHEALKLFWERKPEWIDVSKRKLLSITYNTAFNFNPIVVALSNAYKSAIANDFHSAVEIIQSIVNETIDPILRGWLKQILAEYVNYFDEVEAQNIQKSAKTDNPYIQNPMAGITYLKLQQISLTQSQKCYDLLKEFNQKKQDFILYFNSLRDDLIFLVNTSNTFEQAISTLGKLLGFNSQRPEAEFGEGPDVLWATGDLEFFVIECKNGSVSETISKKDVNQLNGSINWFRKKYDDTCKVIPIVIHKSNYVEKASSPLPSSLVMTEESMKNLLTSYEKFLIAITRPEIEITTRQINDQLIHHKLDKKQLIENFTVNFIYKKGEKV